MLVSHISPVNPSRHTHWYLLSRSTQRSVPIGLHGSVRHSSTAVSHCKPMYPGRHLQMNPSIWSTHVAPFWHGSEEQSSIVCWHFLPVYPASQMQVKSSMPSIHCPPFSQGEIIHSLMFISHDGPVHPGSQIHWWANSLSTQTPCLQGSLEHRSIFSWQRFPEKPGGQAQLKSLTKSVQAAPRRQGFSIQSSVLISHSWPSHPGKHSHLNLPCWSAVHVAPFEQGFPLAVQGSTWWRKTLKF